MSLLHTPVLFLRSCLQFSGMVASTVVWTLLAMFTVPLAYPTRYWVITRWCIFNIWWLKVCCRLDYQVEGLEHVPAGAVVVMANHQSTWETLALVRMFGPQTWVLKRELLRIPLFGWALSVLEPIAIDRGGQGEAVRQMVSQGQERLKAGRSVVIFPEGTRVAPGQKGRYHPAGALLATRSGATVVPVAHNAGEYWGRHQFIKRPGRIQVRIGPPIDPSGKTAKEITRLVEEWIEAQLADIAGGS